MNSKMLTTASFTLGRVLFALVVFESGLQLEWQWHRYQRDMQEASPTTADLRIGLLGGCTMQQMPAAVRVQLRQRGVDARVDSVGHGGGPALADLVRWTKQYAENAHPDIVVAQLGARNAAGFLDEPEPTEPHTPSWPGRALFPGELVAFSGALRQVVVSLPAWALEDQKPGNPGHAESTGVSTHVEVASAFREAALGACDLTLQRPPAGAAERERATQHAATLLGECGVSEQCLSALHEVSECSLLVAESIFTSWAGAEPQTEALNELSNTLGTRGLLGRILALRIAAIQGDVARAGEAFILAPKMKNSIVSAPRGFSLQVAQYLDEQGRAGDAAVVRSWVAASSGDYETAVRACWEMTMGSPAARQCRIDTQRAATAGNPGLFLAWENIGGRLNQNAVNGRLTYHRLHDSPAGLHNYLVRAGDLADGPNANSRRIPTRAQIVAARVQSPAPRVQQVAQHMQEWSSKPVYRRQPRKPNRPDRQATESAQAPSRQDLDPAAAYRELALLAETYSFTLVAMQYPLRPLAELSEIVANERVLLVDQNDNFEAAIQISGYMALFRDRSLGQSGHPTPRGVDLMATGLVDTLEREGLLK